MRPPLGLCSVLGDHWASPVGLLRVDVGFLLDRQPEEKSYRFFFGLGQAF